MSGKFEKLKAQSALEDVGFSGGLYWLDEVDSTNTFASKLLDDKVETPFVVVARKQSAGKGRLLRKWFAQEDKTLCVSFAFEAPDDSNLIRSFAMRSSIAICDELKKSFGVKLFIKWPNDIYSSQGGKISGMLSELKISNSGKKYIIFGIGVNCFKPSSNFEIPTDITNLMASLDNFCLSEISMEGVLAIIAKSVMKVIDEKLVSGISENFSKYDWLKSKDISVDVGGQTFQGVCEGIDEAGELLLRLPSGEIRHLAALEATVIKK